MNKKIQKLIKLSDSLDYAGFHKDSSEVDSLIRKVANPAAAAIPAAAQVAGFDPFKTLDYMKGLDSIFKGRRKDDYYNPEGRGEIGTYEELQKAKQEAQTLYSKDSPNNIVRSVIQKMLNEIFEELTCIKEKPSNQLNKGGKYVFKSNVELMDNMFKFVEPLIEIQDTMANRDQTIGKCLNTLFLKGYDAVDPRFEAVYEKYKKEAMEDLEDPSIFDAGKQYKLTEIKLSLDK